MSALDVVYGRQGGRRADAVPGDARRAIADARRAGHANGTWPSATDDSPGRALPQPGQARMAGARRAAGVALSAADVEALAAG